MTADGEHFDAVAPLAQQQHRRGGTRHDGLTVLLCHGYRTTTERIDWPRFIISKPSPI